MTLGFVNNNNTILSYYLADADFNISLKLMMNIKFRTVKTWQGRESSKKCHVELWAINISHSSNKAWTIDRFFSNMQQKNLELIYLRKSKDLWTNLSKTHFILFSILKGGISVAIVYFDLPVAKFSWHSGKNKLVWYNVMSYHYKKEVEEKKQTRPE